MNIPALNLTVDDRTSIGSGDHHLGKDPSSPFLDMDIKMVPSKAFNSTTLSKASTKSSSLRRDSLRQSIASKRDSLRSSEKDFLDLIVELGNEVEIAHIEKTLQDDILFSTPDEYRNSVHQHRRRRGHNAGRDGIRKKKFSVDKPTKYKSLGNETMQGTARRLELLQLHKMNSARNSLWDFSNNRRISCPENGNETVDSLRSSLVLSDLRKSARSSTKRSSSEHHQGLNNSLNLLRHSEISLDVDTEGWLNEDENNDLG